jgi:hypothetical protein
LEVLRGKNAKILCASSNTVVGARRWRWGNHPPASDHQFFQTPPLIRTNHPLCFWKFIGIKPFSSKTQIFMRKIVPNKRTVDRYVSASIRSPISGAPFRDTVQIETFSKMKHF